MNAPSSLDDLAAALEATGLNTSRAGTALVVRHEHYLTRVSVVAPEEEVDSSMGPIETVIQVRSDLPREVARMITANRAVAMNRMATLGALTCDGDTVSVGSRLTIFESEDAWNIQGMLVVASVIGAADAMLRATGKALTGQLAGNGKSAWDTRDFEQVEAIFSERHVCLADEHGVTAEFALDAGAVNAIAKDGGKAIWAIASDVPHPAVGAGLLCKLELPHRLPEEQRLSHVLRQLNELEMQPQPLPPHFGAWCAGTLGDNPAYVSFLPNALHDAAPGIAANMTAWAWARAQWANTTLASLGV